MKLNVKEIFDRLIERVNIKKVLQYALFLFLALICQTMLFSKAKILGAYPMVLPAVAVSVGMFLPVGWGCVFSLVMGFFADMAYVETVFTYTVLFPALSFGAGFLAQFFINRSFFSFMGAAFLGLLLTGLVQLFRTAAADAFAFSMISTVLLQTLWSMPPAILAYYPPNRWIR